MLRLIALSLLARVASAADTPGPSPLDAVRLADSPPLRHIAAAMDGGDARTAGDLLVTPPGFARAPDPSAWLRATQADNPAVDGVSLRVLTWNVALLDATVFGIFPYSRTPFLKERRPVLPGLVAGTGADILCLQEVWRRQDRVRIEAAAVAAGYLAFHGPRRRYNDGLVVLVRKDLVVGQAEIHPEPYAESDPLEFFPGPRIRRGFLEVAFTHPTLGRVRVYDTHLLAWPKNWGIRMAQVRQLGLRVAAGEGLAFVAGDLNGGSYYPWDAWVRPDGTTETGWWGNAVSWAYLQHYGGLVDLVVRGAPAAEVTADVDWMNTLTRGADGRVDVAGAAGLRHPTHFSATDANVLYGMQYAGTEYPARMDQVFARDPDRRVHVAGARTVFTERRTFGGSPEMEPSDHLGVEVTLRVAPAP